jgi:hypothetical protein
MPPLDLGHFETLLGAGAPKLRRARGQPTPRSKSDRAERASKNSCDQRTNGISGADDRLAVGDGDPSLANDQRAAPLVGFGIRNIQAAPVGNDVTGGVQDAAGRHAFWLEIKSRQIDRRQHDEPTRGATAMVPGQCNEQGVAHHYDRDGPEDVSELGAALADGGGREGAIGHGAQQPFKGEAHSDTIPRNKPPCMGRKPRTEGSYPQRAQSHADLKE